MADFPILWRRLDKPGHESARLLFDHPHWRLSGTAVFAHETQPCRLNYVVICDSQWRTVSAEIAGWVGDRVISIEVTADSKRRWRIDGMERGEVEGCIDIDLGFSPSTNTLPIRRLDLAIGQEAKVRAAWLGFPSLTLEPLEQIYRRTESSAYTYESAGGRFTAELRVNSVGFVTRYPGLWQAEGES